MLIKHKGINVNVKIIGNGEVPILFLHGWGGSTKSFDFVVRQLRFNYKAIFIDFPPFGKSDEPNVAYTLFDYVDLVCIVLKKLNISKPIVVGHSFGGRIAIVLSAMERTNMLVLVSSAGIKVRRSLKYYIKIYLYKLCKKLKIKLNTGSKDYNNLSKTMQQTLINIVNKNLDTYAKTVNVPTLIFWGKKDKETKPYMAYKLSRYIKKSELIIIKNAGHFSYIQEYDMFIKTLNYFIKENLWIS